MNIYCKKPSLSVLSAPVLVLNGSTKQNRNKPFLAPKSVFLFGFVFRNSVLNYPSGCWRYKAEMSTWKWQTEFWKTGSSKKTGEFEAVRNCFIMS